MTSKSAAQWLAEGLERLELAWTADTASQLEEDRREALAAFDEAHALSPTDVTIARHRADTLLALGDWSGALDALVGLRALGVVDARLLEAAARCHRALGALEAAVDEATASLALQPDNLALAAQRADDLLALGRFGAAREAFVQVLSDGAVQASLRLAARIGYARALEGLGEDASDAWFALVSEEEERVTGGFAERRFVDALASSDALVVALRVWLGSVDESAVRLRRVADVLLLASRSAEALPVARRLVEVAPADAHAWHLLGEVLAQARRFDEAIDAFETALDVRPDFSGASARLAVVREQSGRPVERWRLMGTDTFAREDFVIGVFDSKRAALRALKAKEAAPWAGDEALRDTYWVEPA
ncbi:MAG: tetratricopeptide repeat protein [Myxococcaceae bacterium]|nr:tetratricopeptide repeat protein [Myxococcaceae bacterium]